MPDRRESCSPTTTDERDEDVDGVVVDGGTDESRVVI